MRPPDALATELPFVISTSTEKANPEVRRFIRSHVMRGKNKIKPRRKYRSNLQSSTTKDGSSSTSIKTKPASSIIPRTFSSKYAAIGFVGVIEPTVVDEMLLFVSGLSKAMFPLHKYISSSSQTSEMAQSWFIPLLFDLAYFHTACFTVQTYFDHAFDRKRSVEAQHSDLVNHAKAITLLRKRLEEDNDDILRLSDSTIMTILMLYGQAYTIGDYKTANDHANGLLRIVSMRGIQSLIPHTKLMIEITRCDLNLAIDTNSKPWLFSRNNISWASVNRTTPPQRLQNKEKAFAQLMHPDLTAAWAALSNFCALFTTAVENGKFKVEEEVFLHNMVAIMYPLAHQSFGSNCLDEAFRLGLLAFSSPIFLHWNRLELPDGNFTSTYRNALSKIFNLTEACDNSCTIGPRECTWLLMVAAICMAHEPDSLAWLSPLLLSYMKLSEVFTWEDMQELMSSFLWLDIIYAEPGRTVFDSIVRRRKSKTESTYSDQADRVHA